MLINLKLLKRTLLSFIILCFLLTSSHWLTSEGMRSVCRCFLSKVIFCNVDPMEKVTFPASNVKKSSLACKPKELLKLCNHWMDVHPQLYFGMHVTDFHILNSVNDLCDFVNTYLSWRKCLSFIARQSNCQWTTAHV